ncbi:mechanosensitive ion channel family protein [Exiguobacterium sp. SH0S7]|uniref:mechanosensitive ion channel family protein n=1 Tax=Exiguobacterium sp. SH0S7 TaxID=2510951 RepID=UPI00103C72B2|nr:mechanosensitive ion channel family protein [Exiguobacterium sp. SH0S7]TCI68471.1 mechanosensitive ion channel family protein [Exiguobacterium sp. SH0S7]
MASQNTETDLSTVADETINNVNRFVAYFQDTEMWIALGIKLVGVVLIIVALYTATRILTSMVQRVFTLRKIHEDNIVAQRQNETLLKLAQNTIRYVIGLIMILTVLGQFGVNIAGLIASAGVAGLAISFGAQNLVKDVITGAFIIFENQYKNGDYVNLNQQVDGTVIEVGIRTTKLKGLNGQVTIIPNGQIMQVTNYSLENSVAVVDIGVAYEEETERVEKALKEIAKAVEEKYHDLFIEPITLAGVQSLGPSEVVYRLMAEVPPTQHFAAGRILHKELKAGLDERGIEIPYPRTVMMSPTTSIKGASENAG